MRKGPFTILVFVLIANINFAQQSGEFGLMGGGAYYIGDINEALPFYKTNPLGGFFYKQNLNPRQVIRLNLSYLLLSGSDKDFNNTYQNIRNASFSGAVFDISLFYEHNFLDFKDSFKKKGYSPYLLGGVGIGLINTEAISTHVVVPFGGGIKFNLTKHLGMGAEYTFRKTFYDRIDGAENMRTDGGKSFLHNNDWYNYFDIYITFRLPNKKDECPMYENSQNYELDRSIR